MKDLDFKKRKRYKELIFSRLTLGVLLVVVLLLARGLWGVYRNLSDSRRNLTKIERDFVGLETREAFLESELERLATPLGVEEEIRDRFGFTKENEGVIMVVEDTNEKNRREEDGGFWNTVKSWFR